MQRPWKEYGRYGTVGIELVVSILLGYYLGHYADQRWGGDRGWITLVGVIVGVYAGFRTLFKAGKQMQRDAEREDRLEREAWQRKLKEDAIRLDPAVNPRESAGSEPHHDDDEHDPSRDRADGRPRAQ